MKITRLLVLVAMIVLTCSVAMADGTDPVFKLSGGGGSTPLTSDNFSFTVDPANEFSCNLGDVCVSLDFINDTGASVTALNLTPQNVPSISFSCDPTANPYFNSCSPQSATTGDPTISFFGIDATHPGILSAGSITCGDPADDITPDGDSDDTNCTANNGSASDFIITIDLGPPGAVTQSFGVGGTLIPSPEPGTLVLILAAGLGFVALKRSGFAI